MQVRALQGDTVDALAHRYYGSTAGRSEAIYAANPGLADLGPVLPARTLVELPAAQEAAPASTATVRLWD